MKESEKEAEFFRSVLPKLHRAGRWLIGTDREAWEALDAYAWHRWVKTPPNVSVSRFVVWTCLAVRKGHDLPGCRRTRAIKILRLCGRRIDGRECRRKDATLNVVIGKEAIARLWDHATASQRKYIEAFKAVGPRRKHVAAYLGVSAPAVTCAARDLWILAGKLGIRD